VKFSYSEKATGLAYGRIKEDEKPAYVRITINTNGNVITETIALFQFGGDYLSEGLRLNIGDYSLTEFIVLDNDNTILYAAPLQGSELSEFVNKPLPIDFKISVTEAPVVRPEVLKVNDTHSPEDFGYVSFGFDVIEATKPPPNAPTDYREYIEGTLKRRIHYKYGKYGIKQIMDTTYYKEYTHNVKVRESISYKSNGLIDYVHIQDGDYIDEIATYFYDEQNRLSKVEVVEKNGFMRKKLLVSYPQNDQALVFHTHYSIAGYSNTNRIHLTYANDNVVHVTEHKNYSAAPDNWIFVRDNDYSYSDKFNSKHLVYGKLYMGMNFVWWESKNEFANYTPASKIQIFNEQGFLKQETIFSNGKRIRDHFIKY
jgi:hypothetical protein